VSPPLFCLLTDLALAISSNKKSRPRPRRLTTLKFSRNLTTGKLWWSLFDKGRHALPEVAGLT
jgi:hypothetical protein